MIKPLPTIPPYGENAIAIKNLTFSYSLGSNGSSLVDPASSKRGPILSNLNLTLAKGSRCLLIGANGSGKSTLLRILAGRHLVPFTNCSTSNEQQQQPELKVLGLNAFHDTRLNFHRAYLDCDWGMRNVAFVGAAVPLMADIPVHSMMERLQATYPERRDELVTMLGIDVNWRMHQLSDGQRRRVQLFLGLIRPFQVLLLDEVTTSLDVCVRQDLLRWLVKESDERGATVIYATHIFDGLDDWASHLYYLNDQGRCGWQGAIDELDEYHRLKTEHHPCKMLAIAEHWLRKELDANRLLRKMEKAQGAVVNEPDPTDYSQGGFSSGRLQTDEEIQERAKRHARLSDMMGNSGGLDKVRRYGEEN
jgi:CCR4-NOT complex subunit CAF16